MRLITLGGVDLRTGDGRALAGVLSRKKKLALLTYLAVRDAGTFVQRPVVASMFWPDSTEVRSRGALRTAIHELRTELGPETILARGDEEIAVNPEVVWCDATEFERLIREQRLEEALALYRGPLMDGFQPTGIREFSDWVDQRRRSLHGQAVAAVRLLADRESQRDVHAAVPWVQRWIELSPYEEPAIRSLVHVLLGSGNRAAALQAFDDWSKRLARDLNARPSAETERLIRSVRESAAPEATVDYSNARSSNPAAAPGTSAFNSSGQPTALSAVDQQQIDAPTGSVLTHEISRVSNSRLPYAVAAIGAVVLVLVAWPKLARLKGADIGVRMGNSNSAVANEAYEMGERAYLAGQYEAAADAFQRAVDNDTTFALAHLSLSFASDWTGRSGLQRESIRRALRHEKQLDETDRLVLHAWNAHVGSTPRPDFADSLYRAAVARAPDRFEAWYQLAELRYHWGAIYGVPWRDVIEPLEKTLDLVPHHGGALTHLIRLKARRADAAGILELLPGLEAAGVRARELSEARLLAAAASNDRQRFESLLPHFWEHAGFASAVMLLNSYRFDWIADAARQLLRRQNGIDTRIYLRVLIAQLETGRGSYQSGFEEARALEGLAPARSAELAASIASLPFVSAAEQELESARTAIRSYQRQDWRIGPLRSQIAADGIYYPRAVLLDGLLSLRLHDSVAVNEALRRLDEMVAPSEQPVRFARQYAKLLRARIALEDGDATGALRALGEPEIPADRGYPDLLSFPASLTRWTRAEVLERLGDASDAIRWYGGFPEPNGSDLMFVAQAHWRSARLLELQRDSVASAGNYATFLRLVGADASELREQIAHATKVLGR